MGSHTAVRFTATKDRICWVEMGCGLDEEWRPPNPNPPTVIVPAAHALFRRRFVPAILCLAVWFCAAAVQGADLYWDGDPATANAQYGGATGTWSTSGSVNWLPNSMTSTANQAWVNSTSNLARFGSGTTGSNPGTLTLTLAEDITLAGIDIGGSFAPAVTVTDGGNDYSLNFGGVTGQLKPNNAGQPLTLDVVLRGTGGIVKTNSGTAILARDNAYTGGTTLTTGILQVGNGGAAGTLGGGNVALGTGTTLRFSRSDDHTVAQAISGAGTLTLATATTLTLDNSANSVGRLTFTEAGTIELLGNTLGVGVDGGDGIYVSTANKAAAVNGTGGGKIAIHFADMDLRTASGSTLTLNAALVNGTASSVEINGGTVIYAAANTYTGLTAVKAGALQLNSASGPAVLGDITVAAGTSLTVNAAVSNQIGDSASVVVQGSFNSNNKADTLANLTLDTASLSTISSLNITGTLTVTKGTHEAVNSGSSLASHTTVLGGGSILRLGANSGTSTWNMGAGGLTLTGATIQFGNPGGRAAIVNLSGNVTASGTNAFVISTNNSASTVDLRGGTRTFDITSGTTTLTPSVVDTQSTTSGLVKSGAGSLVLQGANTYGGKTTISGGTLALATSGAYSGSLAASPWIQVDSGATFSVSGLSSGSATLVDQTLSGTGSVDGTLVAGSGAVIRPGDSTDGSLAAVGSAGDQTGKLVFTNVTLQTGASPAAPRLVLGLGGTPSHTSDPMTAANAIAFASAGSGGLYDSLEVTGTLGLNAGSTIVVELTGGHAPAWGDVYNLLDWSTLNLDADGAGGAAAFTVADLILPTLDNGWFFETGQFISNGIIYVVPEPGRAALLLLGLLACASRRSRPRR